MDVRHYLTLDGRDPFQEWLDGIADIRVRVAVLRRIDRLMVGNFGDRRFCGAGVWELRLDIGSGFRVYYAMAGTGLLLVLGGGPKRTQQADIEHAVARWKQYRSHR